LGVAKRKLETWRLEVEAEIGEVGVGIEKVEAEIVNWRLEKLEIGS
jgi:hypothetical protein